jgi:ribosome modulation factor
MMRIKMLPKPVILSKADEEQLVRRVWSSCIKDGYAARAMGQPLSACPLYKIEDMAISWRSGWRRADEKIKERLKNDRSI